MNETQQAVAEIFSAANWTAGQKDGWNGSFIWSDASVIGGVDPWGTPRVTVVGSRVPAEAAAWLVQHAIDLRLAPASEPEETPAHEAHEEIGSEEERQSVEVPGAEWAFGGDSNGLSDDTEDRPDADGSGDALSTSGRDLEAATEPTESHSEFDETPSLGSEILDADYTEPTDPPPEDHPSGAFIFGDNLEQQRTVAIGLVMQKAFGLLVPVSAEDDQRLKELRNFAAGVGEGRFTNVESLQNELKHREAVVAQNARIEKARDALVGFLMGASREEIEAFDPAAGWPA